MNQNKILQQYRNDRPLSALSLRFHCHPNAYEFARGYNYYSVACHECLNLKLRIDKIKIIELYGNYNFYYLYCSAEMNGLCF